MTAQNDLPNEPLRLLKGGNASLRDLDEELGSVTVVLETGDRDGDVVDADVSVLLLDADGRTRGNDDFVFYNNRIALDGAINLREKLRTEDDGQPISADVVTLRLDDVPDDVTRIVLGASLDPSLGFTFGAARLVRLRMQRTSDATDLVLYDIDDASDELALLFGEFYRRDGGWRIRAIGQGYVNGLASLVAEFGVDVASADDEADPGMSDDEITEALDGATDDSAAANIAISTAGRDTRVSVQRNVRAPRMPAAWNKTVPSDGSAEWQVARLFPVAGIGGAPEQERRATSALLAVIALVKEFGRDLTSRVGASAGTIETYTEVSFGRDDEVVRPDGVIRIKRGQRQWSALIEVKTSDGKLVVPQLEAYLDVARAKGFDAVVTISNQLLGADSEHPAEVDRRKLRKVALHHLAWDEIRSRARILVEHRGLDDPTAQRVLAEFLRYMDHPRSGMHGFEDMGPRWPTVRDAVRDRTQRASDRSTSEISDRFDQLMRHTALRLSGLLGVEVQSTNPPHASDSVSRCQELADSGLMFGSLKVPGSVAPMIVTADIRADRLTCSLTLPAPKEGRQQTRINWLLRQLGNARESTRVEAMIAGTRDASVAALMRTAVKTPEALLPDGGRDIKAFRVSLDLPLGNKRKAGNGAVVDSVVDVTHHFYAEVVQHLRPWTVKQSTAPKLVE